MRQRIKNKILKKLNIVPLISLYERHIAEWQNIYTRSQYKDICKSLMWFDYKMINKLRGRFSFRDITKYRYKKYI